MKKTGWFLLCAGLLLGVSAAEHRIEAESLNLGKWAASNWGIMSGSRFITGAVRSMDNLASGEFKLADGTYYVWVRTYSNGGNWRKAELSVNGAKLGLIGDDPLPAGRKAGQCVWTRLPQTVAVKDGKVKIELRAKSEFARIDVFIFTTDKDFVPSSDKLKIEKIPAAENTAAPVPARTAGVDIHKISELETIFQRPLPSGNGPDILLFHGGRPWVGNGSAAYFNHAGARCLVLNSVYLNGFGGASIKTFPSDKVEPVPLDGITPAFRELANYRLVVINGIPEKFQRKIFTPERIESLRGYVKNGGNLFVTVNVPAEFGDLLPAELGKMNQPVPGMKASRPESANFSIFPPEVPVTERYRSAKLRPGAKILSGIKSGDGRDAGIFAAVHSYGKGHVLWLNTEHTRTQGTRQFYNWAYGRAFMIALANECAGFSLDTKTGIFPVPPKPEQKVLGFQKITVREPEIELFDSKTAVSVKDGAAVFGDGFRVVQKPDGTLDVYYPGTDKSFMTLSLPELQTSEKQAVLDSATSEAVDVKKGFRNAKIVWTPAGIEGGKTAKFKYRGNDGTELVREFKSSVLKLDGRTYRSLGERMTVPKSSVLISRFSSANRLRIGGNSARRMSAYMPPRGYSDFDMTKNSDTAWNGFFGDSQPFGWVACENGVFSEFVEKASTVSVRYISKAGNPEISAGNQVFVGRLRAPVTTEWFHHAWSEGPENGVNGYLAMWQFQRMNLRKNAGLMEYPAVPVATYSNTCTSAEKAKAAETARKLGFRFFHLQYCPTAIESLNSKACLADYELCRKNGLGAFPWSPCDYCQGTSEAVYGEHPEWFMRDESGAIFRYFGNFPVLDVTNPHFRNWYFNLMKSVVAAGVKAIYLDMGGAAAGNVNFAPPEAGTGLNSLIKIYDFFHKNGVRVSIEGMSPLVIDRYWYRQQLYTSFRGREFALLGAQIGTNGGDDLAIDYFRAGMYGAFPSLLVDGYAQSFERTPGEIAMVKRAARLLPGFYEALNVTGMPFVRETPFGTVWTGKNGGAVFFWHGVKSATFDLPAGWTIKGHSGNTVSDIRPETILILNKPQK